MNHGKNVYIKIYMGGNYNITEFYEPWPFKLVFKSQSNFLHNLISWPAFIKIKRDDRLSIFYQIRSSFTSNFLTVRWVVEQNDFFDFQIEKSTETLPLCWNKWMWQNEDL